MALGDVGTTQRMRPQQSPAAGGGGGGGSFGGDAPPPPDRGGGGFFDTFFGPLRNVPDGGQMLWDFFGRHMDKAPDPSTLTEEEVDAMIRGGGGGGVSGTVQGPSTPHPAQPRATADRGLEAGLSLFGGLAGPQLAQEAQRRARLQNMIGFLTGQQGVQSGFLRRGAANDLAGVGLDRRALGVERGAAARQIPRIDALADIAGRQLANQLSSIDFRSARERQAAENEAGAGGAFTTTGTRRELSAIERSRGLARERAQLGAEEGKVGRQEQRAKARDRQRLLGIQGERLGLKERDIRLGLEKGLANLGLDTFMSVNDLLDRISASDAREAAIGIDILEKALGAAGVMGDMLPEVPAGQAAANPPSAAGSGQSAGRSRTPHPAAPR